MKVVNLSAEPRGKLHGWLPHDLKAVKVVFLPDACPGKSPLPTGTAVMTRQDDWRRFAVSDCGCGMRLMRSSLLVDELDTPRWDSVADALAANKGRLGDLGGGNHFLDALAPYSDDRLHFLVHTGSRAESGLVDEFVDQPAAFDREFDRVVEWAAENRARIQADIETVFGPLEVLLDLPHNTYEVLPTGGAVIRKGAVHVRPGELNVIPSHMTGDVALVRGTDKVENSLCSLSHGTGRAMSRSECKPLAESFDFAQMRKKILIPERIQDASLRTDGPFAYRDLEACLTLLAGYVEEVERYSVIGYMGHL